MRKSLILLSLSLTIATSPVYASNNVEAFFKSHSYSNILPVKQLMEDDWKQSPESDSSHGFTQNEIGLGAYIDNFYFSVSHRYDYFVYTNSDTAEAFYLDRKDRALDTQEKYEADLNMLHQRSNGIRIGYKLDFETFSSEIRIGYWHLTASRESRLTGLVSSDLNGNIAADAQLEEFYSSNNFLRRRNTDDWDTDGSGITADIHLKWQPIQNIDIAVDLTDIYSDFELDNSGYSTGVIDTDGTFINSIGGVAYLPLYRGREVSAKHQFELPKTINVDAVYHTEDLSYVSHFMRQGDINFYYLGAQIESENTITRLMLDIENLAPEIQYGNDWLTAYFSIDDIDIDQAMLLKLGLNINFTF